MNESLHQNPGPMTSPVKRSPPVWQKLLPWLITAACFSYLYVTLNRAASAREMGLIDYLSGVFSQVIWWRWLALMIPYSLFFFFLDTFIIWRVINWFNARISYGDLLPIRGSAYILSILNEQVGKGAIALYLNRRHKIPGWEVGSSMLFVMFCEFYYLLTWATAGVALRWDRFPEVFHLIPWMAVAAALFFVVFYLFFSGRIAPRNTLREKPIFRAFRLAKVHHYLLILLMRSPVMLAAIVVYTLCLRLFGVTADFGELLGYLPVIFFGATTPGPMRSVAILLWVILFPADPGTMTTFGFVQHNFFIFFNASIGLLFLRRANRELFGSAV